MASTSKNPQKTPDLRSLVSQEEQTAQAELEVKAEVNSEEKMICHILTQFVSSRLSESNCVWIFLNLFHYEL